MRLYFDLDTEKFVTQGGYQASASGFGRKVASGGNLEIEYSRKGLAEDLSVTAQVRFGLKPTGKYDGAVVALAETGDFTKVNGVTGLYEAPLDLNTAAIKALLFVDGDDTNDVEKVVLMGQMDWRDAPGGNWKKSPTLAVTIFNSVLQDTDGMESDPVPAYPLALEIISAIQISAAVAAAKTLTSTAAPTNGDTVTIGGQVITYVYEDLAEAPDTVNVIYVDAGTDANLDAVGFHLELSRFILDLEPSLAQVTFANRTFSAAVTASSSGGATVVAASVAGAAGNAIAVSETMAAGSWGGGATFLSGGSDPVFVDQSNKANLESPALTGTPTAPTAAPGTNTTQLATAAFVQAAVTDLLDGSPGALDTLNELSAALGDDENFATTMTNALAAKQLAPTSIADKATAYALTGVAVGTVYKTTDTGQIMEFIGTDETSIYDWKMDGVIWVDENSDKLALTSLPDGQQVKVVNEGGRIERYNRDGQGLNNGDFKILVNHPDNPVINSMAINGIYTFTTNGYYENAAGIILGDWGDGTLVFYTGSTEWQSSTALSATPDLVSTWTAVSTAAQAYAAMTSDMVRRLPNWFAIKNTVYLTVQEGQFGGPFEFNGVTVGNLATVGVGWVPVCEVISVDVADMWYVHSIDGDTTVQNENQQTGTTHVFTVGTNVVLPDSFPAGALVKISNL
jgi:hypothetical protein